MRRSRVIAASYAENPGLRQKDAIALNITFSYRCITYTGHQCHTGHGTRKRVAKERLAESLRALKVDIYLASDFFGDRKAAVDFGDDAVLFGEGRQWDAQWL